MNPMDLFKIKQRLDTFQKDHPKVVPFFQMIGGRVMTEGTVLELKCTTTDGKEYVSNIRVNQNDIEMIREIIALKNRG